MDDDNPYTPPNPTPPDASSTRGVLWVEVAVIVSFTTCFIGALWWLFRA